MSHRSTTHRPKLLSIFAALPLAFFLCSAAPAQIFGPMPVIDVDAIAHLIEQYNTLREQLTTALDQLDQARQEYQALTGDRGMQHLLADAARNYLPPDWQALTDALDGLATDFPAFAQLADHYVEANAILSPEQLARFSEADQAHIEARRRTTAAFQATAQQAMAQNSERFEHLQQLIDEIGEAEDPKAIYDLQARINAEGVMLTNEANKLHSLFQAMQAQETAQRQQRQEQAIADVGSLRDLAPLNLPVIQ